MGSYLERFTNNVVSLCPMQLVKEHWDNGLFRQTQWPITDCVSVHMTKTTSQGLNDACCVTCSYKYNVKNLNKRTKEMHENVMWSWRTLAWLHGRLDLRVPSWGRGWQYSREDLRTDVHGGEQKEKASTTLTHQHQQPKIINKTNQENTTNERSPKELCIQIPNAKHNKTQ